MFEEYWNLESGSSLDDGLLVFIGRNFIFVMVDFHYCISYSIIFLDVIYFRVMTYYLWSLLFHRLYKGYLAYDNCHSFVFIVSMLVFLIINTSMFISSDQIIKS
jgi:hypothetical protein